MPTHVAGILMAIFTWLLDTVQSDSFKLMAGMFMAVGIMELCIPAVRAPSHCYVLNIGYSVLNALAIAFLAPFISIGTATVTRHFSHGLIDLRVFSFAGIGGALLLALISTVVLDFFYYWMHRAQHASAILWQEHLLHHTDTHVNVTTSGRTHILEQVLAAIFVTLPTTLIVSLPPGTIASIVLLPWIWAYMVHANIKLSFGQFWWLLASPQYHRIHHSIEAMHLNRNFAVWFPVWDIVFGTVHKPDTDEYPLTGVAGVEVKTVHEAYLLPFKNWYVMALGHGKTAQRSGFESSSESG